ncbi:2-keto-4-pentenoate hydratase [Sediminitomix flava]|uniref:2-keto-4-pentenoate hydratase n=2 Tax=Sediminitomix flava TaxID=379075 RepID=A0A315Z0V7_SEDFL|nr:2-keto-4-pentenoate hydratase [Sediminitomix flava]
MPFEKAAKELLNRRKAGVKAPQLPEDIRPKSLDDALAIHQEMLKQKGDAGGWKCLLPPSEGQIIAAPIFMDSVQRGETVSLIEDNSMARIEPEIAFVLEKDLPANTEGYSNEEIDAAIGNCHMALELMQARFDAESGATFYEKLADCMVNQGLFIGPEIERELAYKASEIFIDIEQEGLSITKEGKHPNELPQNPLHWFINYMTKRGQSFKAGEAIITGSYAGIVEVDFDLETTISYKGLGEYKVTFKRK